LVSMDEVVTPWYLRLNVYDKPGVMSRLSSILSDHGISIEALIQKPPVRGESTVAVVILINPAQQANLMSAIAQMEALESTTTDVMCIRVENFKA